MHHPRSSTQRQYVPALVSHRRIPLRIRSSPDLPAIIGNSQFRRVTVQMEEMKLKGETQHIYEASSRIRRHTQNRTHPAVGSGIFGTLIRLTSLITRPSITQLDEQVLNEFNREVGIVSSRVDRWRQKLLEEEWSNSGISHSPSMDSSVHTTQFYIFICIEIQRLVRLIRNLTTILFSGLSWLLAGVWSRLMELLQIGSRVVFPVADVLVMSIWRILREFVEYDTEKTNGLTTAVEAINNAFFAIRSLIHLGYAYRNMHGLSDSEYTGDETRSVNGKISKGQVA